jgi:DegV family protein with EDD domain
MNRPAVLLVDPESARRKPLARGLSRFGYEVVPTPGRDEGLRFARGLGPSVIVADAGVAGFGDGSILPEVRGATGAVTRLLVLGEADEAPEDFPEDVLYLPSVGGLEVEELVRRIRLVLVGWELRVEADARLRSLVGDLSLTPVLELIRGLGRALASGRLLLESSEVVLERGEVIAASAGPARGVKAFCRIGVRREGPFRIVLGRPGVQREIEQNLKSLIIRAIEDRVTDPPNPRALVEAAGDPEASGRRLGEVEREVLAEARGGVKVGALLDRLQATDGEIVRALDSLVRERFVTLREPEAGVRVVTDSTGDLPSRLAREHGIHVVPLTVHFGDRVYRDGIDVTPKEFYELLEKDPEHPHSNPPPPTDFLQVYRDLGVERDLVSIHLSSTLSETCANARKAAQAGAREIARLRAERRGSAAGSEAPPVEVVDSRQVSLGLGLLALFAARMAHRELGAAEIARRIAAMGDRVHVLFVVDTLEYLARGGRIGKAQAWVGSLLGIKPILGVVDGGVVPVDG